MMGRVTSMEMFKLNNWDPIKDMRFTIGIIRQLLEAHGQIDVSTAFNDLELYKTGAYTELEYLLLELELLCDKDPRANFKYPPPEWKTKQPESTSSSTPAKTQTPASAPAAPPASGAVSADGKSYWAKVSL